MAYSLVEIKDSWLTRDGIRVSGVATYLCETDADIANLPKTSVAIGSSAHVISTGKVYMFGPSKQWIQYKGLSTNNTSI